MDYYSSQINKLIQELSELPGIGAKSAQRLAFHILNMPVEQVEGLSEAIINARKNVRYCKECFTLTDDELCPICKDASRNHKTIMVVENTRDLAAYEKTQKYDGVYHVLHGAISPMLGIGPNDIKLKELMQRLQQDVDEVIIATNSSLEGETTAMYISKLIKPVIHNKKPAYLVRWKYYRASDDTIEPRDQLLEDVPKLVRKFEKDHNVKWYPTAVHYNE